MVTSFGYQVCGHSSSATKPFVSLRGTYTARVDANRHAGSCSISWETSKQRDNEFRDRDRTSDVGICGVRLWAFE